jgi:hypothetical protein
MELRSRIKYKNVGLSMNELIIAGNKVWLNLMWTKDAFYMLT